MALHLKDILTSPFAKQQGSMNARELDLSNLPQPPPYPPTCGKMNVHIEIDRDDGRGNTLFIKADIDNQPDLDAFHEKYKAYMPRKKWMGIL